MVLTNGGIDFKFVFYCLKIIYIFYKQFIFVFVSDKSRNVCPLSGGLIPVAETEVHVDYSNVTMEL